MNTHLSGILLLMMLFQSGSPLVDQFDRISRKAQGRVGAATALVAGGQIDGIRLDERFPMASVFKLPVALTVLHQIDQGKLALDQKVRITKSDFVAPGSYSVIRDRHPEGNFDITVRELLHAMITVSDGTACDALLRLTGGPAAVNQYLKTIGISGMSVAAYQKELSGTLESQKRNWATPRGTVELLKALQSGRAISRAGSEHLLQLMAECKTGPQRIKGLLPPGTRVSHKTGSMGARATNDVGIAVLPDGARVAIAVFVSDSRAAEKDRERVIAEIARSAWDYYSKKK